MTTGSILIVGKPNCGKSLLFNKLTGSTQKVANFPGVTVEIRTAKDQNAIYIDFPGIYSINPISEDERVAVAHLKSSLAEKSVKAILCLLDATRLAHSLSLGLQVQKEASKHHVSVIFALNMMDDVLKRNLTVDVEGLSAAIGAPVFPISARTGKGLEALKTALSSTHREAFTDAQTTQKDFGADPVQLATKLAKTYGPVTDTLLKSQHRIDHMLLSSWWGSVIFLAIMTFLFQAIFTWATPLMDGVEQGLAAIAELVVPMLPSGLIADFTNDAIFGGFGSFLVFVPQIFIMTLIIGALEDSGYLARAAIICHRPLAAFGLSGRSFVPLLSGHACAIPAIFAARTVESPRRRRLTLMAIPLLSCSARLPVYGLLVAALFPETTYLGGLVGIQGLVFSGVYLFGLMTALVVTAVMDRSKKMPQSDIPFVIELSPYRMPALLPSLKQAWQSAEAFITKAGAVIFSVTVIVWFLGYFPTYGASLEDSYLAVLGRGIAPLFEPLGLDWRYGVAIVASFVAREVFVGTLGTMFGIAGADENIAGLAEQVQASGLTLASGMALLAFYALALQCASTLAVIRKETGNLKLPVLMFFAYSLLAYAAAVVTYALVSAVG